MDDLGIISLSIDDCVGIISLSLVAFAVIYVFFDVCLVILLSPYQRRRLRHKIACLFGRHVPGRTQPAVGGRNIQRCDWCDKVVREYEVTKGEAQQTIRRIR